MELKTCPFCGANAIWHEYSESDPPCSYTAGYVLCSNCGCRTRSYTLDGYYGSTDTKEDAIAAWNKRMK